MYIVDGKSYEETSEVNKKILSIFVKREVKACITPLVEYVFDTATAQNSPPFDPSDIQCEETVTCPACKGESLTQFYIEESTVDPIKNPHPDNDDERYLCPFCMSPFATEQEAKECCSGQIGYLCENCGHIMLADDYDDFKMADTYHIMDWYIVSDWLLQKLLDFGEPIIDSDSVSLWGRRLTTGTLEEEPAIISICKDLEILEGQTYSWEPFLKKE